MAYNGFKGVGPRGLGTSPLKQLRKANSVKVNKHGVAPRSKPFKSSSKEQSPAKQLKNGNKGRIKRDSIKVDRIFRNTVYKNPKGRIDNPFVTTIDNSPEGKARGEKFAKDNNFEGWKKMKKLESQQDKKNNTGRPTQRTSAQKKALTNAWNYTNIYNKKYKKL